MTWFGRRDQCRRGRASGDGDHERAARTEILVAHVHPRAPDRRIEEIRSVAVRNAETRDADDLFAVEVIRGRAAVVSRDGEHAVTVRRHPARRPDSFLLTVRGPSRYVPRL